ncbi:MAG: pilus assembly protein PilM, partial [Patescibacteria group bacterium]|nr:pilus assembly protein PilM [Patescibacteria group bacterium]
FESAAEILQGLAAHDHPRLMERVRHAEQLVDQIMAEQQRWQAEAARILTEAESLVQQCRYHEAVVKLQAVPKPLRSDAFRALLDEGAAALAETDQICDELQRDLQGQLDDQVFKKLMRLLQLQPDHEQGVQLNKSLQGRLYKQARQYLAAFRYSEAAALLEQIPAESQLPAVKQLCTLAVELAWLWSALRHASHVDHTLLNVAERLCKLSPKHAKAAELRAELERRLKTADQTQGARPVIPWAAPRAKQGDAPVTWLADFHKLPLTDDCDPALLVEHRGTFFTAVGLALQGLERARIHVNLRVEVGNAVLNKMRSLISGRPQSAWGIDIGSHALKAVHLVIDRKDPKHRPRIAKVLYVRYAKDLCRAANDDQRNELITEALHELLAESDSLARSRVCVGLSSRLVYTRLLDLPAVEKSKLDDLVVYEAQHQVPMKLDDLTWGYQRINEDAPAASNGAADGKGKPQKLLPARPKAPPEKKRSRQKILVLLIKGEDAIRRLAPFREQGIRVDVAQSESIATYNAIHYELTAPALEETGTEAPSESHAEPDKNEPGKTEPGKTETENAALSSFAAIDIGADSTSLVVGGPEFLWVRQLHQSGESYTRTLVQELQLTFEQAERLKHRPETARSLAPVFRVIDPVTEDMAMEIARAFEACRLDIGGILSTRRFLLGGGARLHGLLPALNRQLPAREAPRRSLTKV